MSLDVELRNEEDVVFEWNITHNLTKMAERAGCYMAVWRPFEVECFKASDISQILMDSIQGMVKNKEYMEVFNPENGWGDYDGLLRFLCEYASACYKHPDSMIWVSR